MIRATEMTAICLWLGMYAMAGLAQETSANRVAVETDWSVFVDENPTQCWAASAPTEVVNTRNGIAAAVNRGQIMLTVAYSPSAGAKGQVAFTGGYPFAEGSDVAIRIGEASFALFTEGEWAWPSDEGEDAKLVAAMKRGRSATVTGLSSRGTTTQDTFSLLGATAAIEGAAARCAD